MFIPGQPIPASMLADIKQSEGYTRGIYTHTDGTVRSSVLGDPFGLSALPIPAVESIVMGIVTRLSRQDASVSICNVDGFSVREEDGFTGIIRANDVRAVLGKGMKGSFRIGDVVRAVVISLGDLKSYYLSTAKNDLGVLYATSADGKEMKAISWEEMEDTGGLREARKCARS